MFDTETTIITDYNKPVANHVLHIIVGQFSQTGHCDRLAEYMQFLSDELAINAKDLSCSLIRHSLKNKLHLIERELLQRHINNIINTFESIVEAYKRYAKYKNKGYVYFLLTKNAPNPLVKIGYQSTINNSRSNEIHSHCPYDLIHIGSCKVANGQSSESKLHRKLQYYRFNREWFRYEEKLKEIVDFLVNRGYYDCIDEDTSPIPFVDWIALQDRGAKSNIKFISEDSWYDLGHLFCNKEYQSNIIEWISSIREHKNKRELTWQSKTQ